MNILFISLGCDKNLVDTEVMLGMLASRGYQMVEEETQADVIVINTCCFVHDAKEESIQNILEMAEYKKEGRLKALIVTGCLAQRYRQEILDEIPEVDAVLGTTAYDKILDAIDEALKGHHTLTLADTDLLPEVETKRLVTTGGHFAYLKIAEGCDKHCTYCIIPKIRGNFRSVPMEQLLSEAEYLAEQGVKELILVAQETTLYGKDLYGEKSLHKLLRELCKISGIRWIRILYCYPEEIYDELIQTIKEEPKICHYLDLPIQHANDEILKRMGRRTTKQELIDIISSVVYVAVMVGFLPQMMGAYGSEGLGLSLEVGQVLMMAFLLIAIAFLYSGIIVLISVFAKDTKEANSYIMPVYMLILILGIATMFTTQNIESWYYAVPVFNTALALQGILTGDVSVMQYAVTLAETLILGMILITVIAKAFESEKVMAK